MRKPIIRAALAAVLLLGSGVSSALATHAYVDGFLNVWHGPIPTGTLVGHYPFTIASCSGTSCSVTVAIGHRDYNRFLQWCGSNAIVDTVYPSQTSNGGTCPSPANTWYIDAQVTLRNASGDPTTHDSNVVVTISVSP